MKTVLSKVSCRTTVLILLPTDCRKAMNASPVLKDPHQLKAIYVSLCVP